MGVVQRNDNVLMIVPPPEPLTTGCQWAKCILPASLEGIVLRCEDASKMDIIPVQQHVYHKVLSGILLDILVCFKVMSSGSYYGFLIFLFFKFTCVQLLGYVVLFLIELERFCDGDSWDCSNSHFICLRRHFYVKWKTYMLMYCVLFFYQKPVLQLMVASVQIYIFLIIQALLYLICVLARQKYHQSYGFLNPKTICYIVKNAEDNPCFHAV